MQSACFGVIFGNSNVTNLTLPIETELFGQETLREAWKEKHGRYNAHINGLVVEEYVNRMREDMLPMVEHFQSMAEYHLGAITRRRHDPAVHLEKLAPLRITAIGRCLTD